MTGQEIDHLVVGAGTAGCVLAARLSEDSAGESSKFRRRLDLISSAHYSFWQVARSFRWKHE